MCRQSKTRRRFWIGWGSLVLFSVLTVFLAAGISAAAATVSDEASLVSAVAAGGTVQLTKDITLTASLEVPDGITVTLDLNGKTLTGTENCSVIINNGTLTVRDSSGTKKAYSYTNPVTGKADSYTADAGNITGGSLSDGKGGGIDNWGKLTFESGTIYNCVVKETTDTYGGGGIYNEAGATLVMNGGSIIGCSAVRGGGIWDYGKSAQINGGAIVGCKATHGGGLNSKKATKVGKVTIKNCYASG